MDELLQKYGSHLRVVGAYLAEKLNAEERAIVEVNCTMGELLIVATLRAEFAKLVEALL
jgi:hypothetical protein